MEATARAAQQTTSHGDDDVSDGRGLCFEREPDHEGIGAASSGHRGASLQPGAPDCLVRLPAGALTSGPLRPDERVIAAVTCDATPGHEPVVRHFTGKQLQELGAALRLPSKPAPHACDASGTVTTDFVVQLEDGRWVNPDLPINGCHIPDQLLNALHG